MSHVWTSTWKKLDKCAVILTLTHVAVHPVLSQSRFSKVITRIPGLRLGFDLWPFDLRVSACQGPAVDYVYWPWCW